jgi:hypothetical protein
MQCLLTKQKQDTKAQKVKTTLKQFKNLNMKKMLLCMGKNGDCFYSRVANRSLIGPYSARPDYLISRSVASPRQFVFSREQTEYN